MCSSREKEREREPTSSNNNNNNTATTTATATTTTKTAHVPSTLFAASPLWRASLYSLHAAHKIQGQSSRWSCRAKAKTPGRFALMLLLLLLR